MPLDRVWKLYDHWAKHPPTHVLLAMFLEYGEGDGAERSVSSKKPGFDFSPASLAAFGSPGKQENLAPQIRKSVEEMQSSPKYQEWRRKLAEGTNG
jgi:hypothetical protein